MVLDLILHPESFGCGFQPDIIGGQQGMTVVDEKRHVPVDLLRIAIRIDADHAEGDPSGEPRRHQIERCPIVGERRRAHIRTGGVAEIEQQDLAGGRDRGERLSCCAVAEVDEFGPRNIDQRNAAPAGAPILELVGLLSLWHLIQL